MAFRGFRRRASLVPAAEGLVTSGCRRAPGRDGLLRLSPPIPTPAPSIPAITSPEPGASDALRARWRPVLLVGAAALAAAVIESTFGMMPGTGGVAGIPWTTAFRVTAPGWLVASLMVPGVLALARRFPFRPGRMPAALAAHAIGVGVFTALHIVLSITLLALIDGRPQRLHHLMPMSLNLLRLYSGAELLTYATIVGVWNAFSYHRESLARARDAAELREKLVEARLDALRLQLQPHFLFNTLHAVSEMARAGETETLVATVAHLGDLLRAVLDERLGQDVTLDEELALLGKYLDIQRVRFRDRLTIQWRIDDECRAARVPSLILQPLVENAMIHGLDARPGPGEITIAARRDGTRLTLMLEDTGPGLAPEASRRRTGIGLANTRSRLEHRYGAGMRFYAENAKHGGARFVVEIPFETEARA